MDVAKAASFVPDRAARLTARRRHIVLGVLAAGVVVLAAFVVLGRPGLRDALLAGVGIHLAVWLLRTLWHVELASRGDHPLARPYRILRSVSVPVVVVTAGAAALYSWFGRDNRDIAVYVAVVGTYVAVGVLLSRWRSSPERDPRWGPGIMAASTAVGLVSLLVATVNVSAPPLAGVVLAVLSFPVGLALVAADRIRAEPLGSARSAWGCAAVSAGLAGLTLAGIGEIQALLLTIVLAVVVGLIASDTSHDVVLVLVVVALVWSLDPEPGPPEPDPAPDARTIVALGDSYMSGEGANRYYRGTNHDHPGDRNECRRAPTAYPVRAMELLADRGEDFELLFLACSGARSRQLTTRAQYDGEPTSPWHDRGGDRGPEGMAQLPQAVDAVESLGLEPDVVLISIGGNDAGFGEIGQTCALAGDCSVLGQRWLDDLEDTRQQVRDTYDAIRSTPALADARFLVIPYPVPLNESGCDGSLLRPDEHRFLVGFTRALDRVLEEEAQRVGFDFLGRGTDAFTRPRLRICDVGPSDAAVNQLAASPVVGVFLQQVSPRGWFHNTFHPNERGHEVIAREVADWIAPPAEPPAEPAASEAPVRLGGIMGAGFDHCESDHRVPRTCHPDRTAWMVASTTRMLWAIVLPVALVVVGALLVSIEVMRRWPRPRGRGGAGRR